MIATGAIGAENNLLEMGTVEVRIHKARTKPMIREWAIVMPETQRNHQLLDMYRRELELPEPMNIGTNVLAWQGLLEYVPGPVVLVGNAALGLWRPDLLNGAKCAWTLDGHTCVWWDTHAVVPCRELEAPKGIQPMGLASQIVNGVSGRHGVDVSTVLSSIHPLDFLSIRCVGCGQSFNHYDRDGVPYCTACWPKEMGKWEIARDMKAKAMARQNPEQAF